MGRKRRIITGLAATGVLAGALAGGGAVLASTGSAAQPAAVTAAAAAASTGSAAAQTADGKGGARFLHRRHAGRLVLRTAASYLGVTPAQLRTQLRAGKSLATVTAARGKSVSGLESAILTATVKRIDASKLTAARKADVISDVKANLNAFVNAKHPFVKAARRLGRASGAATGSTAASSTA
jgi:hypothetical protein